MCVILGYKGRNTGLCIGYKITKFYAVYYDTGRGHSSANVCAQRTETYVDMPLGFQVNALLREKIPNSRRKIVRVCWVVAGAARDLRGKKN